jgi:hypothetical protein
MVPKKIMMVNQPIHPVSDILDFDLTVSDPIPDSLGNQWYLILVSGNAQHANPVATLTRQADSPEGCEFLLTVLTPSNSPAIPTPFTAPAQLSEMDLSRAPMSQVCVSAQPCSPGLGVIRKRAVIILNRPIPTLMKAAAHVPQAQ